MDAICRKAWKRIQISDLWISVLYYQSGRTDRFCCKIIECIVYWKGESEEDQKYGRGFYEVVASDLNYKQRFIHSSVRVLYWFDRKIFKEKRKLTDELITDAKEIWNYGKRGSGYGKRPI